MNHLLTAIYGLREVADLHARQQARAESGALWWQAVAGLAVIAALGMALVALRVTRRTVEGMR